MAVSHVEIFHVLSNVHSQIGHPLENVQDHVMVLNHVIKHYKDQTVNEMIPILKQDHVVRRLDLIRRVVQRALVQIRLMNNV